MRGTLNELVVAIKNYGNVLLKELRPLTQENFNKVLNLFSDVEKVDKLSNVKWLMAALRFNAFYTNWKEIFKVNRPCAID